MISIIKIFESETTIETLKKIAKNTFKTIGKKIKEDTEMKPVSSRGVFGSIKPLTDKLKNNHSYTVTNSEGATHRVWGLSPKDLTKDESEQIKNYKNK